MANSENITKEVVKRLGEHFKDTMDDLVEIYEEFPEANFNISYPSISIVTLRPTFRPEQAPYTLEDPESAPTNYRYDYKYVIGYYEFPMQVDLWCRNKEERNRLYDQFFKSFHSQFPVLGLSLTLERYHDLICRYDFVDGFTYEDTEAISQRKEWRATIEITALCEAIYEKTEYVIETTEVEDTYIDDHSIIEEE